MADNVAITAGSGTTISTEEVTTLNGGAVSAQQVQRVAIASRTADGTAIDIPATTADGVLVNLGANNDVTVTGSVAVTNSGITTIAGAVAGTEMQVDVLTMPTVTVTATNLDVQSGGADLATSTQAAAIQTGVELIDDAVKVLGTDTYTEATSKGIVIGAVRRDADTTLANTTNEFTPLQVDANGYLKVEVFSGATLPVSFTGSTDVATQTTLASALTALQLMDDWDNGASDGASVSGDVAHDTVDAGEPVKIGMKAYELDGTAPQTAVAEADRVNAISDLVGRQYVATEHPRFWHVSADYASAQTNASVKAAPGASLALYVTDIMISNGATAGNVTLLDGSGGTVLFEVYPAINGGAVLNLKNPIKLTDNTALCITSTTVTTHSVFVSGFID